MMTFDFERFSGAVVPQLKFDEITLTILVIGVTNIDHFIGCTQQIFLGNKDIFCQNHSLISMDPIRSQLKGDLTTGQSLIPAMVA